MKYILGMAKRSLDLTGAKGPKLELDYLRLVYAVNELRRTGADAKGYLLVMTDNIAKRVAIWQEKYQAGDAVMVIVAKPTYKQLSALKAEVLANTAGMIAGTLGEDVSGKSNATVGGQFGEEQLRYFIEENEPGVLRNMSELEYPFQIRWDFYGKKI